MFSLFSRFIDWLEAVLLHLDETWGEPAIENYRWSLLIGALAGLVNGPLAVWASFETNTHPLFMIEIGAKTAITIGLTAIPLTRLYCQSWWHVSATGLFLTLGIWLGVSGPILLYWSLTPSVDQTQVLLVGLVALIFLFNFGVKYAHPLDRLSTKELIAPGSPLLL